MIETINLAKLANLLQSIKNCKESHNEEWEQKYGAMLDNYLKKLPSGSGIDSGISFEEHKSTPNKLIFSFGFHHMDENGYYAGWTQHKLIITPSLVFGYKIKITGKNRNQVKDYLYDLFSSVFHVDYNNKN